jgi:hypothetical protein
MDGNWGGPWAMAVEANHVWVGGEFKLVAGCSRVVDSAPDDNLSAHPRAHPVRER